MRKRPLQQGIKSVFSRASRKIKEFFGWRGDIDSNAHIANLSIERQTAKIDNRTKKPNSDDGEGGSGDNISLTPRTKYKTPKCTEIESAKLAKYSKPTNYAKPPSMTDEEFDKRTQQLRETTQRHKKEEKRKQAESEKKSKTIEDQRRARLRQQRVKLQNENKKPITSSSGIQERTTIELSLYTQAEKTEEKDFEL